jgi:type IV pilus assembly protein PilM
MPNKAIAIDIGSHRVKVIGVKSGKHGLAVTHFASASAADGLAAVRAAGVPLKGSRCGLAGRDMTLRYSQVPPTPDWQLKNLMDLEIQDLAQQSGGRLSADYNLLPPQDEAAGVDTVLLALAKDEALARLSAEVQEAGGSVDAFVPNCVALYNAWLKCGSVDPDAVVCLASLGHETIDIALVKGADLLFARNLSGGGKVLDDAIAAAFNVSGRKAEALKHELIDLEPGSRGRFQSGQEEKVTMAAGGAANAIAAGIQSSLAFCKAQTKIADLRLDKVVICGGSARLRGLRGMLREALRCPVEEFDAFANLDLAGLSPAAAEDLFAHKSEAVIALGLAVGAVDDSLYSLEILPEAVRRKKRLLERTVWNVAAVLIVAALLLLQSQQARAAVDRAEGALRRVSAQHKAADRINDETKRLIEQNKKSRALADALREQAMPLHGALRVWRAIHDHLPPELWLKTFESSTGANVRERRPLVTFAGGGKEIGGVAVTDVFQRFSPSFKKDPRIGEQNATQQMPATTSGLLMFDFTVDFQKEKR